jgi:hypothetical protein
MPKKTVAIDIGRVAKSLDTIITTLAWMAYQGSEDSGDGAYYVREKLGGRKQLYADYWENRFKAIFQTALSKLAVELRDAPAIKKLADSAFKRYRKALADKAACDREYRKNLGPSARMAAMRLFDGKRDVKLA